MFPITCNAVGDIVSLLQIAGNVACRLNSIRSAPAEYRELVSTIERLRCLLEGAMNAIEDIHNGERRSMVDRELRNAFNHIASGLDKLVDFEALDTPQRDQGFDFLAKADKAWHCLTWTLKGSRDVRRCLSDMERAFPSLNFAISLAVSSEHTARMQEVHQSVSDIGNVGARVASNLVVVAHIVAFIGWVLAATRSSLQRFVQDWQFATLKHTARIQEVQQSVSTVGKDVALVASDISHVRRGVADIERISTATHLSMQHVQLVLQTITRTAPVLGAGNTNYTAVMAYAATSDNELYNKLNNLKRTIIPFRDAVLAFIPSTIQPLSQSEWIVITTSLLTASMGFRPIAALATALSGLAVRRYMYAMFKNPTMEPLIVVIDFFDRRFGIPYGQAQTSQAFYRALVLSMRDKDGYELVQAKYFVSVRVDASGTDEKALLPESWDSDTSVLCPGDHLRLDSVTTQDPLSRCCPSCRRAAPEGPSPADGWIQCTYCVTKVTAYEDIRGFTTAEIPQRRDYHRMPRIRVLNKKRRTRIPLAEDSSRRPPNNEDSKGTDDKSHPYPQLRGNSTMPSLSDIIDSSKYFQARNMTTLLPHTIDYNDKFEPRKAVTSTLHSRHPTHLGGSHHAAISVPRPRNYVCEDCGKEFESRPSLEIHIRIHTGERPFACTKCAYRGTTKGNLTRHEQSQHQHHL